MAILNALLDKAKTARAEQDEAIKHSPGHIPNDIDGFILEDDEA